MAILRKVWRTLASERWLGPRAQRSAFLTGAASAVTLTGQIGEISILIPESRYNRNGLEADRDALNGDWYAVREDLGHAAEKLRRA